MFVFIILYYNFLFVHKCFWLVLINNYRKKSYYNYYSWDLNELFTFKIE